MAIVQPDEQTAETIKEKEAEEKILKKEDQEEVETVESEADTEVQEDTTEVEEQEGEETEDTTEDLPDSVKEAMDLNKQLKEELEELKTKTTNVFEENAVLQAELDEQKKLAEMAKENAEIKAQLEKMKRNVLVEGMLATGKITNELKEWAEKIPLEQLEEFNKLAPKQKTILDQINNAEDDTEGDAELQKWHKEMMKSRIL